MNTHNKENNAADWAKLALDKAIHEVMKKGVLPEGLIEARMVWALPEEWLIGQVREVANHHSGFLWVITGQVPTDVIASGSAVTAREAAKHFSMKWQVFASRLENAEDRKALGVPDETDWQLRSRRFVEWAEELYAIAEEDRFWQAT